MKQAPQYLAHNHPSCVSYFNPRLPCDNDCPSHAEIFKLSKHGGLDFEELVCLCGSKNEAEDFDNLAGLASLYCCVDLEVPPHFVVSFIIEAAPVCQCVINWWE